MRPFGGIALASLGTAVTPVVRAVVTIVGVLVNAVMLVGVDSPTLQEVRESRIGSRAKANFLFVG